jgi:RNA polymerase sigma-70 factor (ECF subfamily)
MTALLDNPTETENCNFPNSGATVAELVLAAQAGDRTAFGELVERFQQAVFHTALRKTGDVVEAQELVQDVFVQALRKIGQLRTPEAFGGWLRSIASRRAINRAVRRRAVQPIENEVLDAACVESQNPLNDALQKERARHVRAGLRRLKALDRHTLVAFYVEGQSLAEMSSKFASPIGTIKRRLHTARKRLAAELGEFAAA